MSYTLWLGVSWAPHPEVRITIELPAADVTDTYRAAIVELLATLDEPFPMDAAAILADNAAQIWSPHAFRNLADPALWRDATVTATRAPSGAELIVVEPRWDLARIDALGIRATARMEQRLRAFWADFRRRPLQVWLVLPDATDIEEPARRS